MSKRRRTLTKYRGYNGRQWGKDTESRHRCPLRSERGVKKIYLHNRQTLKPVSCPRQQYTPDE